MFSLENQGLDLGLIKEKINKTIEDLNVEKLMGLNLFEMSGGEKQALAFACAYAMNPDIYILDEPSANFDTEAVELLQNQLQKIKEQGKTILIAEHRMYYLINIIDRAIFMENGEIHKIYSRKEFLAIDSQTRKQMGLRTRIAPKKKEKLVDIFTQTTKQPIL